MVTKSKKPSFRTLYNQRQRAVRRAGEADGHSVALRDSEESNMATAEKGSEPESLHDRDRVSPDEQAEANESNASDSDESDSGDDDEV